MENKAAKFGFPFDDIGNDDRNVAGEFMRGRKFRAVVIGSGEEAFVVRWFVKGARGELTGITEGKELNVAFGKLERKPGKEIVGWDEQGYAEVLREGDKITPVNSNLSGIQTFRSLPSVETERFPLISDGSTPKFNGIIGDARWE